MHCNPLPFAALALVLASALQAATPRQQSRTQFVQDQSWPDDKGVHINAHGGGVMFYQGVYYWFGESYRSKLDPPQVPTGVHCYSSADLYNWKDQGVVLARVKDPRSDITEGSIIERPKVIYNAKTGKFVMWFHLETRGQGYKAALSGIAVADRVTGPYRYLRSERPDAGAWPIDVTAEEKAALPEIEKLKTNPAGVTAAAGMVPKIPCDKLFLRDFAGGQMARDMNLFVDDDGKAYHIFASEDNMTLHISQLSDDYLSDSGKWIRVLQCRQSEAPALCKYAGRYWLIASGCSGWDPNTARSAVADSIWGPWTELGNPCTAGDLPSLDPRPTLAQWKQAGQPSVGGDGKANPGPGLTFGGQSTCIFPVEGKPGVFIAMFDIWRARNLTTSGYVWLTLVFASNRFTIPWRDPWSLP